MLRFRFGVKVQFGRSSKRFQYLRGKSGWFRLQTLTITSGETLHFKLFSAMDDQRSTVRGDDLLEFFNKIVDDEPLPDVPDWVERQFHLDFERQVKVAREFWNECQTDLSIEAGEELPSAEPMFALVTNSTVRWLMV